MTAADQAVLTKLFIAHLPRAISRNLYDVATEQEFWEFWDWLTSLPPEPDEPTIDEYIRHIDPTYWSDEELAEIR